MFFRKKKNYKEIFKKHYENALSHLTKSEIAHNAEFELFPVMIMLASFATQGDHSHKNAVADDFVSIIYKNYLVDDVQRHNFIERLTFYNRVIKKHYYRADWDITDELSKNSDNFITNLLIIFGDILVNPDCVIDYEEALFVFHDVQESIDFQTIMIKDVLSVFLDFIKEINND